MTIQWNLHFFHAYLIFKPVVTSLETQSEYDNSLLFTVGQNGRFSFIGISYSFTQKTSNNKISLLNGLNSRRSAETDNDLLKRITIISPYIEDCTTVQLLFKLCFWLNLLSYSNLSQNMYIVSSSLLWKKHHIYN